MRAAWLVIAALSGCSLGIQGPRAGAPVSETPKCDTGRGGVFGDGLLAVVAGSSSIAAFDDDETGLGISMLAIGGLFVAAAVHGNGNARDCEQAEASHAGYVAQLEKQRREAKRPRRAPTPAVATPPAMAPTEAAVPRAPRTVPTPAEAARALVGDQPAAKDEPQASDEPAAEKPDDEWSAFWEEP